MKRLKQLLVFCMVAVLAFSFTACGSGDETTLSSISVDYSAAKTEYYVGEDYSSDGLVVTANYSDNSTTTLTSGQYTVDSSAYSKTTAGTYAITVSYEDKSQSYNVTVVIAPATSLTLNTSAVTTTYYVGQTLSLSNLTATAAVADGTTKSLTYSDLTIDTSAVDMSAAGSYTVKASYTLGGATVSDEFVVTVKAQSEISTGLSVTKTTVEYTVESATGVTVSIDDLAVYMVEDDVVSTTALDSGSYELSYYKISDAGSIDVDNLTKINSLENLTVGRYEIWATVEYSVPGTTSTYDLSNCVVVYVLDELTSISVNTENAESVFTQTLSTTDSMSSTWTYTATYASSATEQLTADDVTISNLSTTTATTDGEATVSYSVLNAKGETETVSCKVAYTITAASSSSTTTYTFSYEELTEAMAEAIAADADGDKVALDASYFTGSNAFLTYSYSGSGTSNQWRNSSNGSCFELKDADLYVTFSGTGTISITFSSTGGSNTSSLALVDENGNYITGTTTDATVAYDTDGTTALGYYTVTGTSGVTVTFNITTAGKYYIKANVGGEGKAARIKAITMTDVVGSSVTENSYTFSYEELTEAMAEAIAADADGDKVALDASYFTGSNAFLTYSYSGSGTSNQWRNSSNGSCFELKDADLYVTFAGTGTISITFSSTGGSNTSSLALVNENGDYVTGTTSDATVAYDTDGTTALGYYTVTGTSGVTVTFDITTAGKYYIKANVGGEGKAARIKAITMTDIVGSAATTEHANAFSYDELTTAMAEAIAADADGDKVALDASYFTGSNAFLTYSYSGSGTSNQWRNSSNGSCFELKDADLYVTFVGTGTISITFSSTGGSNTSSLALVDENGNYITGTTTDATVAYDTDGTTALGYYTVTGTSGVTVTFNITTAGKYYIKANVGGEGKAARIKAISMSDIY